MQSINKEAQKQMQNVLEMYHKDKSSFKNYFQSMKEISSWLQGKSK